MMYTVLKKLLHLLQLKIWREDERTFTFPFYPYYLLHSKNILYIEIIKKEVYNSPIQVSLPWSHLHHDFRSAPFGHAHAFLMTPDQHRQPCTIESRCLS